MGGHDDLITSLKALMAARREELGEPPTPEELLAYRDARLAPAERQRIAAKLAFFPEAARALADLESFPAVEAARETPELSAEEIGARWQEFRRRLADLPAPGAPEETEASALPAVAAPPGVRSWHPALRLAAAALVALGVGGTAGFLAGRASRERTGSAINVKIAELAPADERGVRSAASAVEMPEGAEELVLVLGGRAPEEKVFPAYEAELEDGRGIRVWSRQGLLATSLGTFHLSFRRGALGPGRYRIHLFGRDGPSRALLGTYDLRLLEAAEPR